MISKSAITSLHSYLLFLKIPVLFSHPIFLRLVVEQLYLNKRLMNISERDFTRAIKKSWSRETSGDPEHWSEKNPSYRQCLYTALLTNEFLGLDIYIEKVILKSGYTGSHYFNKDNHGTTISFCDEQFKSDPVIDKYRERKIISEREQICEYQDNVKEKYDRIKKRFQSELRRNLLKDVVNYLLERRSDCTDDLPPCAVGFDDPKYYKYKCRTARWTAISAKMEMLMKQLPGISENTQKEMNDFREYIKVLDYSEFRTKEEIDEANVHLDKIIALLKTEEIITRYSTLTEKLIQKQKK